MCIDYIAVVLYDNIMLHVSWLVISSAGCFFITLWFMMMFFFLFHQLAYRIIDRSVEIDVDFYVDVDVIDVYRLWCCILS